MFWVCSVWLDLEFDNFGVPGLCCVLVFGFGYGVWSGLGWVLVVFGFGGFVLRRSFLGFVRFVVLILVVTCSRV